MSETASCQELVRPYCAGNGIDIGSGGDPVVPWAIQIELPSDKFRAYGCDFDGNPGIEWRGDGRELPFKDVTLDFVYSSHLLEDFLDWKPVLTEWTRVLKAGGHLVMLLPDKLRFNESVRLNGGANDSHKHESYAGELTSVIQEYGKFEVILDALLDRHPLDYNIAFIAKKLC